jgi:hypothetical protein
VKLRYIAVGALTVVAASFYGARYYTRTLTPAQAARSLRITIESAHVPVPGGHVALWLGANDRLHDWIQGGLEVENGDTHPWLYLETGHAGQQTRLHRTAWAYGKPAKVRLIRGHDGYWQMVTNGVLSPVRVKFRSTPTVLQDVEETHGSSARLTVNGVEEAR